jgi:hypothetical protein
MDEKNKRPAGHAREKHPVSTHLDEGFDSSQTDLRTFCASCEVLACFMQLSLQSAHNLFERGAVVGTGKRFDGSLHNGNGNSAEGGRKTKTMTRKSEGDEGEREGGERGRGEVEGGGGREGEGEGRGEWRGEKGERRADRTKEKRPSSNASVCAPHRAHGCATKPEDVRSTPYPSRKAVFQRRGALADRVLLSENEIRRNSKREAKKKN